MQQIMFSHGYTGTSLIECDSYIRRFYQYSTAMTSMSCPYFYKKSLHECKLWALKTFTGITPHECQWLPNSLHSSWRKQDLPWACKAGLLGLPKLLYIQVLGGSCDPGVDVFGLMQICIQFLGTQKTFTSQK